MKYVDVSVFSIENKLARALNNRETRQRRRGTGSARAFPALTALALAILVGCLGCGQGNACGDAAELQVDLSSWVEPSEERAAKVDEIVVHVDVSSSMAGYVTSGSEFSRVLGGLDRVAGGLQPRHSISVRSVGRDIRSLGGVEELRRLARDRAAFDHGESQIVSALEAIDTPGDEVSGGVPRCHLFVTDGLQYSADRGLCDEGHDPRCLGARFRQLIERGWGMHVFAIRSRFDGTVDVPGRPEGVRLRSDTRSEETFRPFLLLVLVDGDVSGRASSLAEVAGRLRSFLEATVSPSKVRELHLSAPLVHLERFELHADQWRLRQRRQPNPARVVRGTWEGPDGALLPDWVHRVQVEHRRPKLANATPFLLRMRMELALKDEGAGLLTEAELDQIAQGLHLVEVERTEPLPPVDGAEEAGDGAEPAAGEEAPRSRERPCEPKVLQVRSQGPELPADFEVVAERSSETAGEADGEPRENVSSLGVESFVELSWSELGDYPPATILELVGPETFLKTERLPDWVSDWSIDRSSLARATSSSQKAKLLDLAGTLERLASREMVGRVFVEPQYVVLEPCRRPCEE